MEIMARADWTHWSHIVSVQLEKWRNDLWIDRCCRWMDGWIDRQVIMIITNFVMAEILPYKVNLNFGFCWRKSLFWIWILIKDHENESTVKNNDRQILPEVLANPTNPNPTLEISPSWPTKVTRHWCVAALNTRAVPVGGGEYGSLIQGIVSKFYNLIFFMKIIKISSLT